MSQIKVKFPKDRPLDKIGIGLGWFFTALMFFGLHLGTITGLLISFSSLFFVCVAAGIVEPGQEMKQLKSQQETRKLEELEKEYQEAKEWIWEN